MLPQIRRRILRQRKARPLSASISGPPSIFVALDKIATDKQEKPAQFRILPALENNDYILPGTSARKQLYYSTAPLSRGTDQTNYHRKLLQMTETKQIDFKEIETLLASIEKNGNVRLSVKTFFLMVKNFAAMANVQAAEAAEALVLKWMVRFGQQHRLENPPRVTIFGMLLQLWVKTRHPDCGKRAESVLNQTEELVQQGALNFPIDTVIYNTTIQAYAIHGDFENAERIFGRCMADFEQGNEKARPDAKSYSSVVNAHAKSNQPKRAEYWLEAMFKDYQSGNWSAQPDVQSFTIVMNAWARSGTERAARRCEKILIQMNKLSNEGTLPVRPNSVSYSSVINACAKSNHPQRAEFWLSKMFNDYQSGNRSAQPDIQSFNTVLNAWASSGTVEATEQCEKVLNHMIKLANEGVLPVRPDVVSYSCLINACGKSFQPQRAKFWLEEMLRDYQNGNRSARPDVQCFNTLLDAWARSGSVVAAMNCEKVIDQMIKLTNEGTLPVRPDRVSYNVVINAWATIGEAKEALGVFDRMLIACKDGNQKACPNIVSCKSLLKAFRNSGLPDAGERADVLLEDMQKLNLKPDHNTYDLVLQCWECALGHGHKEASDRIKELDKIVQQQDTRSLPPDVV